LIAVTHTHLPLTTSNAATDQLERENMRKARAHSADETAQISTKSHIDSKNKQPPFKQHKNNSKDAVAEAHELDDASLDPTHRLEDNQLTTIQYTISANEDYAHFTTHKEPIQGVVFYQNFDKGYLISWSNQAITVIIPATDDDLDFLTVQLPETTQPYSLTQFTQPEPHLNDLANPLNTAPKVSHPSSWDEAQALEHPEQILNRLEIVTSKEVAISNDFDAADLTVSNLDIKV
jgi:hypothetical protein